MTSVEETDKVVIELTADEALVLFEWISRFNDDEMIEFEDQAEQRVLWSIEGALERLLVEPFKPDYDTLLERARARVRDSTD